MSGTRSASRTGQAIRQAVLVAHGQPSDPVTAEAALARRAAAVADLLPGWVLRSATLAAEGALAGALAGLEAPLVYPVFMADGWFTRTLLPKRLAAAGAAGARVMRPLGLDPALAVIAVGMLHEAARKAGFAPGEAQLVLAAHGSATGPAAAAAARELAARIAVAGFAGQRLGYIEEEPYLKDAARGLGDKALCLPLFAAEGGHVTEDIPQALAEAGFSGVLLPSLGMHPDVAGLIARALQEEAEDG